MAKKKRRPSIGHVVRAIKKTTDQLEDILESASPAQKKKLKKLKLNLATLGKMNRLALHMCTNKILSM